MSPRKYIGPVAFGACLLALAVILLAPASVLQTAGLALGEWAVRARYPEVRRISTAQLAAWLADPRREPPVLMDTRGDEEFKVSHLPNAVREVPAGALAAGRSVVMYCSVGWRSADVARQMARAGATNVLNLEGAIFAWAGEGRAMESQGQPVRKVHPYGRAWGWLLPDSVRSDRIDAYRGATPGAGSIRWATGPLLLFLFLWWETLAPFLPLFSSGWRIRVRHGFRNIALALLNSGLTAVIFAGVWTAAATWAAQNSFGILNWLKGPPLFHTIAAVLILDIWTYWWHRLNHRVPFLWRFHRAHHSDAQMDVTTASRFHVGEIFLSNCLRIPLIVLLGIQIWEIVIYGTALIAVIQFHHANIGLPRRLDQLVRCFIVTPAMHKVHHSRWQPETDSNYSSLLSIWDRVFSSFRLRDDPRTIQFGLDEPGTPEQPSGGNTPPRPDSKRRA